MHHCCEKLNNIASMHVVMCCAEEVLIWKLLRLFPEMVTSSFTEQARGAIMVDMALPIQR